MTEQIKSLDTPIEEIMTKELRFVKPDTILSEIARIFEHYKFHHLPVINKKGEAVGMISKSDYHKLQHHFTIFNYEEANLSNERIFSSLIAEEIVAGNPVTINLKESMYKAIDVFLENRIHSLVVTDKKKCVGIITPHDIMKYLSKEKL